MDVPGSIKDAVWKNLSMQMNFNVCKFCTQRGHKLYECVIKARMDRLAKTLGVKQQWGQVKYVAYFKEELDSDQNLKAKYEAKEKLKMETPTIKAMTYSKRRY